MPGAPIFAKQSETRALLRGSRGPCLKWPASTTPWPWLEKIHPQRKYSPSPGFRGGNREGPSHPVARTHVGAQIAGDRNPKKRRGGVSCGAEVRLICRFRRRVHTFKLRVTD